MPDMRMMAVIGDPIFMLIGRRSAIVAAGPSPGKTPTAVPRIEPMRHQRRFTGLKAIWKPCQRPRMSNMVTVSFCAVECGRGPGDCDDSEEEPPWERGLQEAFED